MFEPTDKPRFFGLPPGSDFPKELVAGLRARWQGMPPHYAASVRLIVNTRRMARRVRTIFEQSGPGFVPRISLVTDTLDPVLLSDLPKPVSGLRRRLEIVQLVRGLLAKDPTLAAQSSAYDLADSLVSLMDEMRAEGVLPQAVMDLDVSDSSGHWLRAQQFFGIVAQFDAATKTAPDAEALIALGIDRQVERWQTDPPEYPVIVAGSTGSRGHTARLMQAVARLPNGAVVLPGLDPDTPEDVWTTLSNPLTSEDHPQYRFSKLLTDAGLSPTDISPWHHAPPPDPERNRVVSLALRPAPVTDQWLSEGPNLPDLVTAMQNVTLVEAPGPREEAAMIALRLRQAVEDGQTAALITPDRMLTRRVSAALDTWGIVPDDSAGEPLQLSPPGRFLRHVSALFHRDLTSDALLTLLKHPLTHSGQDRNEHLRLTRDLELYIRDKGLPFPTPDQLLSWAEAQDASGWGKWLANCLTFRTDKSPQDLSDHLDQHIALAEKIAGGPTGEAGGLWDKAAGRAARELIASITREAAFGGSLTTREYNDLFGALLAKGEEVRDRDAPHPKVLIWGTLEARVQGADLVLLGGLNEGSWPEIPAADPWLNRKMRNELGMLLPERRIGLSAHDFQQAVAAKEVWLTRSVRSDDAQTVPSRWLNRLINLLGGLKIKHGPEALAQMRARGAKWAAIATELDRPTPVQPAPRPSVVVPVPSRPRKLSVTQIKTLIRDPYAIYAKEVLRLRPLDPLYREPDALLRGTVLHELLDQFVDQTRQNPEMLTTEDLRACAASVLRNHVPWASVRHLWQARIDRIADWFVEGEQARQKSGGKGIAEERGQITVPDPVFTLSAKADRIDLTPDGLALIYDYKTGAAPSASAQKYFDKQLLLEAAMVENGGFQDIGPRRVLAAAFISVSASPSVVAAPLDEVPAPRAWAEFQELIRHYFDPDTGYSSRRAQMKEKDVGDYDHLARHGEWDETDTPVRIVLS